MRPGLVFGMALAAAKDWILVLRTGVLKDFGNKNHEDGRWKEIIPGF